jgi:hypothetical protein
MVEEQRRSQRGNLMVQKDGWKLHVMTPTVVHRFMSHSKAQATFDVSIETWDHEMLTMTWDFGPWTYIVNWEAVLWVVKFRVNEGASLLDAAREAIGHWYSDFTDLIPMVEP